MNNGSMIMILRANRNEWDGWVDWELIGTINDDNEIITHRMHDAIVMIINK
jgi:hypothetical protein